MSLDLLERQIARQRKHINNGGGALTGHAAEQVAKTLEGNDVDNAAPTSSASVLFDDKIARKIAVARRALDRKANVREHIAKYEKERLPDEYADELNKAVKVAQSIFGKGKDKKKKTRRGVVVPEDVRVPLAERAAAKESEQQKRKSKAGKKARA